MGATGIGVSSAFGEFIQATLIPARDENSHLGFIN